MVKINKKLEYALMALMHLQMKPKGEITQVKEISEVTGASFDVLSRVMQKMVSAKILRSEQGSRGGYQLNSDLSYLSLYQLSEVILGPVELAKCIKEPEGCQLIKSCNIYHPILNLNTKVAEFYKSLTVREVLMGPTQPTLSHLPLLQEV